MRTSPLDLDLQCYQWLILIKLHLTGKSSLIIQLTTDIIAGIEPRGDMRTHAGLFRHLLLTRRPVQTCFEELGLEQRNTHVVCCINETS